MKHFFFVSNNLMSNLNVVYPKETTFFEAREKTMLSKHGDLKAIGLTKIKDLENVEVIYSSNYTSALMTSKYIAELKHLDVLVDKRLNERVVGDLGSNEYRFLKGMQEHDFNYKLNNGESIKEVYKRMKDFFEDLLREAENNVLVVTHNIALMSLCLKWCNKDYNLDERLILEWEDEVLFDGIFHEMDVIEVVYNKGDFVSMQRIL